MKLEVIVTPVANVDRARHCVAEVKRSQEAADVARETGRAVSFPSTAS